MQADQRYQKLLTEVIKKEILVLGPAISLAKARNVKGLTISEDGTVTAISGNPQELTRELIDQFMELSGLIVKKTMEPILAGYPDLMLSIQPNPTQIIPETIPSSQITTPANQPTAPIPAPLQDSTNANQKPTTNSNNF
jgi:hypothetical protein